MSYFDKKDLVKSNVTLKQLKHYKNIQDYLKSNLNTQLDFVLVGSEKDYSKNLVIKAELDENYYYEFDQTPYNNDILKIIEYKYLWSWNKAIELYPNTNYLITNGSSDFIPLTFFKNIILNYDEEQPISYGITGYNINGFVIYMNNKDDIYILSKKNLLEESNSSSVMKSRTACLLNTFIGGCYALNKCLLNKGKFPNYKIDNKSILYNGNEYVLEKFLLMFGTYKFGEDYFINYKVDNHDYTEMKIIINIYNAQKIDINDTFSKVKEFSQYINTL